MRPGSEGRLPAGCTAVPGNALDAATFASRAAPADTLAHLVGVSHPAPWKKRQLREVDLASVHPPEQRRVLAVEEIRSVSAIP